ncbi:MAG: FAD-binding protein, partial [Chloroflexota bacterium]
LPSQLQIGLTGRSISPRFYFAVAISGQLNHLIGLRKAGTIVAINSDPEAPIFKNCDLGIVGDYAQVLPALGRALQEAKPKRD